ncbi:hypothetical protein GCM10022256_34820 [Frondihabitans peucedani]|uniref:GAF domain-containing protein n=1 Tax=Frondihabitans peucedani TaxID=598626 RepID=A0ABP8E6M3_9MICO
MEIVVTTASLVPITRVVMNQKYRTLPRRANSVPRPVDGAHQSTPAKVSHSILLLGSDYAISWGVRTHALALPGHLARELPTRTGVGADIDVLSTAGMGMGDVETLVSDRDLQQYDAVVVLTGVGDAFTLAPTDRWESRVRGLIATLRSEMTPAAPILLVGTEAPSHVKICRTREDGLTDQWAHTLNALSSRICDDTPGAFYTEPTPVPATALDPVDLIRFKSPAAHRAWAASIARQLNVILDRPRPISAEKAEQPQDVSQRLTALNRLGILYTAPEARFTRVVRRARDLFGTEGAAFSLITDRHQWNKAMVGFDLSEVSIQESFCATTVQSGRPFVVEDAWADPRITFDTFVRFYAGFPIMAPDGTRVGALCVFDANPRSASTIDVGYLEELAAEIGRELAESPTVPTPAVA